MMSVDPISETEAPGERSGRPTLRVQISLCERGVTRLEEQEAALEAERLSRIKEGADTSFVRSRLSDVRLRLDESRTRLELLRKDFKERVESRLPEIPSVERRIRDKKRELVKVGDALGKHLSEGAKIVGSFDSLYAEIRALDSERSQILERPSQYFIASVMPAEIRSALAPNLVARFRGIVERFKGGE
jgi:ASC-1-like (ASCH) protein